MKDRVFNVVLFLIMMVSLLSILGVIEIPTLAAIAIAALAAGMACSVLRGNVWKGSDGEEG